MKKHITRALFASLLIFVLTGCYGGLRAAAAGGDLAKMQELLDEGEDIDAVEDDYVTPLYAAMESQQTEAVKFLLEKGADVHAVSDHWKGMGVPYTPLAAAIYYYDDTEVMQMLVDKGADVNQQPERLGNLKDTALTHAAGHMGELVQVKFLLTHGAKVDLVDEFTKETPLIAAAQAGHVDSARILLLAGCDVTAKDYEGMSARDYADKLEEPERRALIELLENPPEPDPKKVEEFPIPEPKSEEEES